MTSFQEANKAVGKGKGAAMDTKARAPSPRSEPRAAKVAT